MKKILLALTIGFLAVSCSTVNTTNNGMLYTDSKASTMLADGGKAMKTGTACTTGIIGIVTGDSSIEAAMMAGGIKKVSYVDHTAKSVLGLYTNYCTIVHGR